MSDDGAAPIEVNFGVPTLGRVLSFDGARIVVQSPRSSPPGSTLRGRIEGVSAELSIKVHNCRLTSKEPEAFTVTGRLQNATRELLEVLRSGSLRPRIEP